MYSFGGVRVGQKNVTLSLDEEIYENYKEFCKKHAIALSKSIENYMQERIDDGN